MLFTISEHTFLKDFGKHCDFRQTQSTQGSTACAETCCLNWTTWFLCVTYNGLLLKDAYFQISLLPELSCYQESYLHWHRGKKVSTNFSPITWCTSCLHSEPNLTSYPSVSSCTTIASLLLLGRAAVATGFHLSSDSSTVVLHSISLDHSSSIEKYFQYISREDLPTGHLVGVYFSFFSCCAFFMLNRKVGFISFTLLQNLMFII